MSKKNGSEVANSESETDCPRQSVRAERLVAGNVLTLSAKVRKN